MRRMFGQMITPPPNGAGMDIVNATEAIIDATRGARRTTRNSWKPSRMSSPSQSDLAGQGAGHPP